MDPIRAIRVTSYQQSQWCDMPAHKRKKKREVLVRGNLCRLCWVSTGKVDERLLDQEETGGGCKIKKAALLLSVNLLSVLTKSVAADIQDRV